LMFRDSPAPLTHSPFTKFLNSSMSRPFDKNLFYTILAIFGEMLLAGRSGR
jgi:hypothetical protein